MRMGGANSANDGIYPLQGKKKNLIFPFISFNIQRQKQDFINGLSDRHSFGDDKNPWQRLLFTDTLVCNRRNCRTVVRKKYTTLTGSPEKDVRIRCLL